MDARERYDEICDDLAARNPEVVLTQMMGMPAVKADGKLVCGYVRSRGGDGLQAAGRARPRGGARARGRAPLRPGRQRPAVQGVGGRAGRLTPRDGRGLAEQALALRAAT